jgi:hypothetical protein
MCDFYTWLTSFKPSIANYIYYIDLPRTWNISKTII